MKSKFAPLSESPLRQDWSGIQRARWSGATVALVLAGILWCGIAQGAPRRTARPAAPEGKTISEPKTVQRPAPERRRLITFYERFYPGAVRSFTTWW